RLLPCLTHRTKHSIDHELVGDFALLAERDQVAIFHVLAIKMGDRRCSRTHPEKVGHFAEEISSARHPARQDKRQHAKNCQAGEDNLLMFPKCMKGIESHYRSL